MGACALCAGLVIADGGPSDEVSGSARFGFANMWIEARSGVNGERAKGRVRLQQGRSSFTGRVTCLRVEANRAMAGGEIVSAEDPQLVGTGFLVYTEDATDTRFNDRSQTIFLATPPETCPRIPAAPPRYALSMGGYVVRDN